MRLHAFVLVMAVVACRNAAPEPSSVAPPLTPPSTPPTAPSALPPGHPPVQGGGPAVQAPSAGARELQWTDPVGWRRVRPSSTMRKAQYVVPGAGGAEDAELTVFYFGHGQGGSVQDNVNRWHGQFEADGSDPQGGVFNEERTANGLRVHITGKRGRFAGGGMGGAPSAPREGWALLGAIVETPEGPWFFKMVGPRATVDAARRGFDDLVSSFRMP